MNIKKNKNNLFIIKYPELVASEWDYTRNENDGIDVNTITAGSGVKAWWKCDKCHGSYQMTVHHKTSGRGCPYCAGKKVLRGFNDLASQHPDLINNEWDYEKNNLNGLKPDEITLYATRKAWWHCNDYNHSYQSSINNRVKGSGCPFCAGKKVLKGFNDLQSNYPELVSSEWDWIENDKKGLKPDEITSHSSIKSWWRCEQHNHSYESRIYNRTNGYGCPYCSGKKVLKGYNDLQSCYPELINSSWDWVRNDKNGLKPDEIAKSSNIKACWHCNVCNGHYEMRVYDKTRGIGCPYCASQKVLKGFNDLMSNYPELIASEWDWKANNANGIYPDGLTKYSNVKVGWKCSQCSHEWVVSVNSRTGSMKSGCPSCSHRISKQENQVSDYINEYLCEHYINMNYTMLRSIKFKKIYNMKNLDPDTVLSNDLQAHLLKELDIYIPELNLAIEYDGDYWHNDERMLLRCGLTNIQAHSIKQELCKQADIKMVFITEHEWLRDTENVKQRIADIIDDYVKKQLNMNTKKNNLLIITHSELLSEWDYEMNNANNIDVNTVTYGSKIKAYWKCLQYGHSYQMMIQLRTSGSGCPYCAGKKVLPGFNDAYIMSRFNG